MLELEFDWDDDEDDYEDFIIPYTPRDWQKDLYGKRKQFNVIVVHRRAGKTDYAVHELTEAAMTNDNTSYAYIAPTYSQVKDIAWGRLKEIAQYIPDVEIKEGELSIFYPNGSRIRLYGGHNPDTLRGQGFDGIVIDETQDVARELWEDVLLPTLMDRKDWFVIFLGTPKGRNMFFELYHDNIDNPLWFTCLKTVEDTGFIHKPDYITLSSVMSEEKKRQEWFCDFYSNTSGTFYNRYLKQARAEGRIGRGKEFSHDPAFPVYTSWDIGINDATTIWFWQYINNQYRFIDYEEASDLGLKDWIDIVNAKPYRYAAHYGPHDTRHRDLFTGLKRTDAAADLGFYFDITPSVAIEEGIEAARRALPDCTFNEIMCARGIMALENYQSKVNSKTGVVTDIPLHDEWSHGADAFRYFAVNVMIAVPEVGEIQYY